MSKTSGSRRPLKTRNAGFAKAIARWLSKQAITPNQISVASVGFAILAGICLVLMPVEKGLLQWLLPLLAGLFVQGRLLCNLLDGMVAVEGGKGTKSGELYNEIPDRIADAIILVAAGYAVSAVSWAIYLGWIAAILAVMTAYIRALCTSLGAPVNFQGPMAKPHRMATLTIACAIMIFWPNQVVMFIALFVIISGSILTCYRRTKVAYKFLESH